MSAPVQALRHALVPLAWVACGHVVAALPPTPPRGPGWPMPAPSPPCSARLRWRREAAMFLLLMACTTSDPEDTAGTACPDYSVTECADHAECQFIDGRPLQDDGAGGQCVDFGVDGEPLGCLGVGMGCGAAETLAAPPDDPAACTWFPSTCIPSGWVSCGDVADECPG